MSPLSRVSRLAITTFGGEMTGRRFDYERAKKYGTEVDEWVIEQTGTWDNPVVGFEEIVDEFDEMDQKELREHLLTSEHLSSKEIGDETVFW